MKTCVILNPHAGTAIARGALEEKLQALPGAIVLETMEPGEAAGLAQEAVDQGYERIVAAGGDGTINQVLNGLAGHFGSVELGILPLGTANDFARSLHIPPDLAAAVELLRTSAARPIDVVRYTGAVTRYFLNASAGGFSGLVNEALTDEMKLTWGPLAYLRSAAEVLPNLIDYKTFISLDDGPEEELKIYNLVVANGRYVAGGIPIAPEADFTDGLADIIIVPAASMLELAVLVPQFLLGTHLQAEGLIFRRARSLSVRSQPGMWFNVDGELIGNAAARFEVLPRALRAVTGAID